MDRQVNQAQHHNYERRMMPRSALEKPTLANILLQPAVLVLIDIECLTRTSGDMIPLLFAGATVRELVHPYRY